MCSRKNHIKLRATATSPSLLPFLSPSNRSFDLTCLSSYHQGIKAWTTSAFSLAKWEKYLNLNRITLITPQKPKKNISKWFWFFLSMKTHWFLVLLFWRGGCLWEIPRTHPASSWWRRAAQHGVPFLGIFGGLWFRSFVGQVLALRSYRLENWNPTWKMKVWQMRIIGFDYLYIDFFQ